MMKILSLNALILLNLYNHAIQSMDLISDQIYTISSIEGYSTPIERGMVATQIDLIKYDKENFTYNIEYRQEYKTKVGEQRLNLMIMIPYCFASMRDTDFKLSLRKYELSTPHQDKEMFLQAKVPIKEQYCNIGNFNMLDERADQSVYAKHYTLADKRHYWENGQLMPFTTYVVIPYRVMLLGKCPTKGYSIYEVYYNQKDKATVKIGVFPDPFLLFSEKLINKDGSKLRLNFKREQSNYDYWIDLSSLNVHVADTKKQLMIQWMLKEYRSQNKYIPEEIIKYIMNFVHQTCLI